MLSMYTDIGVLLFLAMNRNDIITRIGSINCMNFPLDITTSIMLFCLYFKPLSCLIFLHYLNY